MEILNKLKFSRRYALRGALSGVGVAMWLPVLDIMCNASGTAFAQGAPLPTTFGIFCWGNGVYPGPLWTPSTTGDGNAWQLFVTHWECDRELSIRTLLGAAPEIDEVVPIE